MTKINFDKLNQFQKVFNNEEACMSYYEAIRWPEGIQCVYCSSERCYRLKKSFHYKCSNKQCYKKFNLFSDSIFAKSKLSFDTWFLAIYMIVTHRTGWSSRQGERNLEASQGGVWFLLHRIRHAMKLEITEKLRGIVEVDECMFGPIIPNMHKWRIPKDVDLRGRSNVLKKPIIGMIERRGELRLFVADDASSATLDRLIEQNISKGATVYTDEHRGYCNVRKNYQHDKVSHGKKEYVNENNRTCHVNTVEGTWGLLKPSFKGTFRRPSHKHLQRYCDEFAFNYNNSNLSTTHKFNMILLQTIGKRLKFEDLTAKAA